MKRFKVIKILSVVSFLIFANISFGQDSSKIIVLHKRIGPFVDQKEKIEYEILPIFNTENFLSAIFYQGTDSLFYCKIKMREKTAIKDTTLLLSYSSLINMAVRIQFIENRRMGLSSIDVQEIKLKFAKNKEVKNEDKSKSKVLQKAEDLKRYAKLFSSERLLPIKRTDLDYSELLIDPIKLGFSIGIRYNNSKYRELSKIFNLIEENVPEAGYEITKSDFNLTTPLIFNISSLVSIEQKYLFELEYAFNGASNSGTYLGYSSFDLSFGYIFNFFKRIDPYAMISYSNKEVKANNEYWDRVDSVGGTLESITLVGNLGGVKLSLGVKFSMSPSIFVDIRGSYAIFPKADIINRFNYSLPAYPKVNMDGFELGIKLNFY